MAENRIKRRVLVEQESLAGLLSATDIARSWQGDRLTTISMTANLKRFD
jgi:signal-transduction protein with cAMP-binding, CBS, and nucleotidyltransferase domain